VLPLLPTAYHAYAVDLRGFGDSERPADAYTIDSSPPTWWHSWTRSASPGRP
jgi:pimeloyl-ACP methyl ester carboxylesterase